MDECGMPDREPGPGGVRLTGLEEALAAWLALFPRPVAPSLHPLPAALGKVLAETIHATAPVPDVASALRDGWAVASAETYGASTYAPAPLAAAPPRLRAGDPLPPGTDAVLSPFDLVEEGPFAQAVQPVAPGEGVRQPGEEIAPGATLRAAGERLRAQDIPALAALGQAQVALRIPRLACLDTDETIAAMLGALAAQSGAAMTASPASSLGDAATTDDLLLLAGGPGEGGNDRGAALLTEQGRLIVHGIGMRPGQPTGFGVIADRPVLLLPGRAEDALAAWILFVRPALAALSDALPSAPRRARLTRRVASTVGLAELVPLRLDRAGGAEPLAVGALPLGALCAADGFLAVPPGSEGYEAGAEIPVLPP